MFLLSVIDKNDKRIELKKCRSQIDIDKFTTCFEDSEYLLRELGLDDTYKIEITEYLRKDDPPTVLDFTGSKYRNVIYNYNNIDYFKRISSMDRNLYRTYFNNELLSQGTKQDKYSSGKKKEIYRIFEILKSNDHDYREKLATAVSNYFKDYYSAFKKFYKFVIEFTKREELIYPDGTFESLHLEVLHMLDIISGKEKAVEKDYDFEDESSSITTNPLSSLDDKVSELDMFLDEQNISEEEKKKIIDKKVRKL